MSNRRQNQSCRPSPVVWGKHWSKWSMRLGSWCFRPSFFLGIGGTILFKIRKFGVQKKRSLPTKPNHAVFLCLPMYLRLSLPDLCWKTTFSNSLLQTSNPLFFLQFFFQLPFPDWIKNKTNRQFFTRTDHRGERKRTCFVRPSN